MLKINLLPPELRRKKRKKVVVFEPTQTFLILVVVCELLAFTGVYLMINTTAGNKQKELNAINAEIERLKAEVRDVENLKSQALALEKKVQIIDELMLSRLIWSKRLNELSNLLPENVWITSLSISTQSVASPGGGPPVTKKVLNLTGKVLNPPGEKAVDLVGTFMNNMKTNPSFSAVFDEPEFISSSTESSGDQQLLVFGLRVPLK